MLLAIGFFVPFAVFLLIWGYSESKKLYFGTGLVLMLVSLVLLLIL